MTCHLCHAARPEIWASLGIASAAFSDRAPRHVGSGSHMIYARMCLLGVSMMNNHIYGSKVSQNSHFGGLNMYFKRNMQKNQIARLYLQICVSNWHEIWQAAAASNKDFVGDHPRMVVKQYHDGGRPPFWKSLYRHISVNKNLAIANRSRVSWAHNTSTASIGLITHDLEI